MSETRAEIEREIVAYLERRAQDYWLMSDGFKDLDKRKVRECRWMSRAVNNMAVEIQAKQHRNPAPPGEAT